MTMTHFTELLAAENWAKKLRAAGYRVDFEPWERTVYPLEPPAAPDVKPRFFKADGDSERS